ncbi:M23 family metallopeptidase [Streptomyces ochraceiscleroticus]|uniref:M23 family metallopeptidase n=1 Tax=Streptomyces ochraceiscleroticus TaxID=47761 RepID=A0ABW1MNV9_9ACTN|nr:M23 family metallopeptidase [Streptomyces ochraceiscleroticus]
MSKFSLTRYSKKPALRTRATVLVAGMGASLALGAGAASAMDGGAVSLQGLSTDVGSTVSAQADAQKKAIDAEKKAVADRAKAAADRHERAERQLQKTNGWEKPVDKYGMGEKFGLAGSHWSHKHSGQDFVVPTGTKVKAAHEGTVVKAGPNGGGDGPAYGNAIVIKHGGKTYTQYAHLSQIQVQVGQKVSAGQQIALSGSTGNSTGPHLHFEVRTGADYGTGIEPMKFLQGEHLHM